MNRRAISVAIATLLLATPAIADKCDPPNVARVVIGIDPTPPLTDNDTVLNITPCDLVCPIRGPCSYQCALTQPVERVVCLTPEQNAAAMSAWRQ